MGLGIYLTKDSLTSASSSSDVDDQVMLQAVPVLCMSATTTVVVHLSFLVLQQSHRHT